MTADELRAAHVKNLAIPQGAPPCFGIFYDDTHPVCQECFVRAACEQKLPVAVEGISVQDWMMKEQKTILDMFPCDTVEQAYALAHLRVYGAPPRQKVNFFLSSSAIEVYCREQEISPYVFFVVNLEWQKHEWERWRDEKFLHSRRLSRRNEDYRTIPRPFANYYYICDKHGRIHPNTKDTIKFWKRRGGLHGLVLSPNLNLNMKVDSIFRDMYLTETRMGDEFIRNFIFYGRDDRQKFVLENQATLSRHWLVLDPLGKGAKIDKEMIDARNEVMGYKSSPSYIALLRGMKRLARATALWDNLERWRKDSSTYIHLTTNLDPWMEAVTALKAIILLERPNFLEPRKKLSLPASLGKVI